MFRDFDGRDAARQRNLTVEASSPGAIWGSFDWGDASWGAGGEGTRLERGPSFGPARSIQLLFEGESTKAWGVNGLVLKYIPRRLR